MTKKAMFLPQLKFLEEGANSRRDEGRDFNH